MKCYKTKWILTSSDEVLQDMAIIVDEGKIVDIIPNSEVNIDEKFVRDLGNAVVTPGFIDMFTQYQYTEIDKVRPYGFKNKMKKIFQTVGLKFTFAGVKQNSYSRKWAEILAAYFSLGKDEKIKSFKEGITQSIKAGTTCVAQVSKEYKYFEIINRMPIKSYLFFEAFADSKDKSKQKFKKLRSKVEDLVFNKGDNTHIGIMLNSISGVHKKLWELSSKYCRKHNMLMMTRFAESKDEMEWLEHGFSDIDLLHKFMGFGKISPYEKGISPVEYLNRLKVLTKKVIIANANYASKEELQELADTGVKFVYQPYYNDEICNRKHTFENVLKYFGQNFGFSTQSFKPDKDFSLLKEAINANQENVIDIVELVKYLTIYPARILRLDNSIGSIEVGKDADFNVFKLFDGEDYNALKSQPYPFATYSKGKKLVKDGKVRFSL